MQAIGEFLSMGGYGAFVWPSYVVAAVLLLALAVFSLRDLRAREAELSLLRDAVAETRRRAVARSVVGAEPANDP